MSSFVYNVYNVDDNDHIDHDSRWIAEIGSRYHLRHLLKFDNVNNFQTIQNTST